MMDSFKRSLDNYLTSNDREFGDVNPCVDGHEWGDVMVDSAGAYRLCCHCDNELSVTADGIEGECDKCEDTYELSDRTNRCGECGNCNKCCTHKKEGN